MLYLRKYWGRAFLAAIVAVGGLYLLFSVRKPPQRIERTYPVSMAREQTKPAIAAANYVPRETRASSPLPGPLPSHITPAADPASEEPVALEPEDQVAHVDTLHASETVDRGWMLEARQALDTGLTRYIKDGSRIVVVDCRSSLCKVEVSHPDLSKQNAFVEQAFSVSDYWPGARMAWREEHSDGTVTSKLFFVKAGMPLPQVQ